MPELSTVPISELLFLPLSRDRLFALVSVLNKRR